MPTASSPTAAPPGALAARSQTCAGVAARLGHGGADAQTAALPASRLIQPPLPLPHRFEHPHTGSCGYGRLDGYAFGADAVAAMPDVNPDWKAGSCGRCYELKCRGIQARR